MFVVSTKHAAENNSYSAKLRESTRIAMIAHGLHQIGQDVVFRDIHPAIVESGRFRYFKHIPINSKANGISVSSARPACDNDISDVLIKTSVGGKNDLMNSKSCSVFVCVERSDEIENALDIPFFVHERFLCDLMDNGMMSEYMNDDIEAIRNQFSYEKTNEVVFNGHGGYGRKEFFHGSPDWVDSRFYDTHSMSSWDHAQWLCQSKAAVAIFGDTPKTNLPPLLALLGVPVVSPTPERNTPPLDENSMIIFQSWEQVAGEIRSNETLERISDNATEIYKGGWSPMGVARQIVERTAK